MIFSKSKLCLKFPFYLIHSHMQLLSKHSHGMDIQIVSENLEKDGVRVILEGKPHVLFIQYQCYTTPSINADLWKDESRTESVLWPSLQCQCFSYTTLYWKRMWRPSLSYIYYGEYRLLVQVWNSRVCINFTNSIDKILIPLEAPSSINNLH